MRFLAIVCVLLFAADASAETLVYIGTYTRGASTSEGIYVSRLDEASGSLSQPVLAATLENPSFVALHPTKPWLYAVSEVSAAGKKSGGAVAFSIEEDGKLTKLNEQPTGGGGACHIAVDPTGRCVGVANYGGGSCVSFPVQPDGSLGRAGSFQQHVEGSGVNPRRQKEPHAHSINFNADGTQAFVADLGKDQILIYDVDPETATMKPANQAFLALPPGGGPRHFCFHPTFDAAFTNLEMTSQVVTLGYDAKLGTLSTGEVHSTLPESTSRDGNSTAECLVHPNGRFVYVSNRGHNSIACFSYDAAKGEVRRIENESTQGEIPRGFGIDPSGKFLVLGNQRSGNVVSFRIDPQSGRLTPTGHSINVDAAVNVRFKLR
jgi:6-phosphogluconolactonase